MVHLLHRLYGVDAPEYGQYDCVITAHVQKQHVVNLWAKL